MKNLLIITTMLIGFGTGQLFGQEVGNPAPDFEVDLLGGTTFTLSEQAGKVVLVFLFGNNCPSCLSTGNKVETSIYQVFKDNANFTAIGLDTWDNSSNENSVTAFKNTTGITFPLGLMAGNVAATFQTTYDRLMVIDHQGILVHKGVLVAGNDINNAVDALNQSLTVTALDAVSGSPQPGVYPNPVSDKLHINAGGKSISGISIYEITGNKVIDAVFSGGSGSSSAEVSLQHLEPGVYLYSIQVEGSPFMGKLLIQR